MERIDNYEFMGAYKHKGYRIEIAKTVRRGRKSWEAFLIKPGTIYKLFIHGEPIKQPNADHETTLEEFLEGIEGVVLEWGIEDYNELCEITEEYYNKLFFGEEK